MLRKALIPSLIATFTFIVVALAVGYTGLGRLYSDLVLGELTDSNTIVFILVVAYIPAFVAGLLSPLFERGVRSSIKNAVVAAAISLILGIILSVVVGSVFLGLEDIYGYVIWMAMSGPLYFFISLVSIVPGYILILILIYLYRR